MDKLTLLIACSLVLVAMIALLRRSRFLRLFLAVVVVGAVFTTTGATQSLALVGIAISALFIFYTR